VRVACEKIPAYAREIGDLIIEPPAYDESIHFRGTEDETVAYLVTLDSVNFGSGYFPHLAKRPGLSGYGTIAASLTERFRTEGPIPAARLAGATPDDCARIFGQDLAVPPLAELMALFAQAWNDLGRDLLNHCRGSFTGLIDAADGLAAQLIDELCRQPLFRDVNAYRGHDVPFYKRAQILASDLALALGEQGRGKFGDLGSLTIFADNVVPHVLRADGILVYEPRLARSIERGDLVPAGSDEETEIRACALHAVELLAASLRSSGCEVAPRILDIALWERGRGVAYKATPRHRTRTPFY